MADHRKKLAWAIHLLLWGFVNPKRQWGWKCLFTYQMLIISGTLSCRKIKVRWQLNLMNFSKMKRNVGKSTLSPWPWWHLLSTACEQGKKQALTPHWSTVKASFTMISVAQAVPCLQSISYFSDNSEFYSCKWSAFSDSLIAAPISQMQRKTLMATLSAKLESFLRILNKGFFTTCGHSSTTGASYSWVICSHVHSSVCWTPSPWLNLLLMYTD